MSRGTTDRSNYEAIAKSIRDRLGETTQYLPSEMARAIQRIVTPDKEVYVAYVVGETEYAVDWLSEVEDGEPLTPQPSVLYVIATEDNYGEIYRWDGESYVAVGGSGGISADSVEYPLEVDEEVLKLKLLNSLYVYNNSLALGYATTATGSYAHAEGMATEASGGQSHAEGAGSKAQGSAAHAEGNGSIASGSGSHAEGGSSTASGVNAHAEGGNSSATSANAHAEGAGTLASGYQSHAEGGGTTASGVNSHAEGGGSEAHGENSHAGGYQTKAYNSSGSRPQTVFGAYNVPDATEDPQSGDMVPNDTYALIVGNGTSQTPSNALELDWDGNLHLSGKVASDSLPSYVDDVIEGYMYQGSFYEDSAHTVEVVGETGKIYVDLPTDTTYRWSGSSYVSISNPIDIATQAEAESGVNNTKMMTPLRTRQALEANPQGIPTMSPSTKGGAKLDPDGGLVLNNEALGIGSLVQESDGTTKGGIVELTAEGTASQVSTIGLNMAKPSYVTGGTVNGVTWNYLGNGRWKANGTNSQSSATNYISLFEYDMGVLEAGTYVVALRCKSGSSSEKIFPRIGTGSSASQYSNYYTQKESKTETIREFTADGSTQFWACVELAANAIVDDAVFELHVQFWPFSKRYEPYTGGEPSPSLDYPQEIQVVRGRNLLDTNGEHSTTGSGYLVEQTALALEAGNYILTGEFVGTVDTSKQWQLLFYDESGTQLQTKAAAHGSPITVTLNQATARIALFTNANATVRDIMLTVGSTPQPYVPYGHVGMEVRVFDSDSMELEQGSYSDSDGSKVDDSTKVRTTGRISVNSGTHIVVFGTSGYKITVYAWNESGSYIGTPYAFASTDCTFEMWDSIASIAVSVKRSDDSSLTVQQASSLGIRVVESVTPVSLPERGWVGGVGDESDVLTVDGTGGVEWKMTTDMLVMDGMSKAIARVGTSSSTYQGIYSYSGGRSSYTNAKLLSTHFAWTDKYYSDGQPLIKIDRYGTDTEFYFLVNDSSFSTVAAWNSWLQTHNVTVLYKVTESIEERCESVGEMPEAPSGSVISISELDALNVKYFIDNSITDYGKLIKESVQRDIGQLVDAIANAKYLLGQLGLDQNGNPIVSKQQARSNLGAIGTGDAAQLASVSASGEVTAHKSVTSGGTTVSEAHNLTDKMDASDYRKALKWGEVSDEWLWGETGQTPSTQGTTYTDNLNLIKPGLETTISVDDFNDNADILDDAYGNVTASMADIEQTTATSNHAVGDYFMLGGVLMRTTSAIATGEQITASNAVPATLQSQIDTLRDSVSLLNVVPSNVKLYNIATSGTTNGFSIGIPENTSCNILYFDMAQRLYLISHSATAQSFTITKISGPDFNATSSGPRSVQLRVGNLDRAFMLVVETDPTQINETTVSTY